MPDFRKKGLILFIVIGIIIVVAILSAVILRIISSHSRLTHHQISRIQAQYAARAAVIYALDKLRRNDSGCWPAAGSYTIYMRRSGAGCDIIEPNLPSSIQDVAIDVGPPGSGISGTRKISAKATYTY